MKTLCEISSMPYITQRLAGVCGRARSVQNVRGNIDADRPSSRCLLPGAVRAPPPSHFSLQLRSHFCCETFHPRLLSWWATFFAKETCGMSFLCSRRMQSHLSCVQYRGTSRTRKRTPLGPYRRPMPRVLGGWAFCFERSTPVETC